MAAKKKFIKAFDRATGSAKYYFSALALSVAAGVGFSPSIPNDTYSTQAPVQNAAQHDAAVSKIQALGDDLIAGQLRLNMADRALHEAQTASLNTDLETQLKQYGAVRAEQKNRIIAFQNEIIMNPALSEKEAKDLYWAFANKAANYSLWNGALSKEFTSKKTPFIYRDECKAENTGKSLEESLKEISVCAHAKAAGLEEKASEILATGFAATGGTMAGFLGLSFFAGSLRRREERKEGSAKPAVLPETKAAPALPKPVDKPAKKDLEF